ncbi:RidA family protein [Candidatus Frankia alpina]|uniref:RidA family protein n=1 Tax=Candidatus Frankia alpina TaxID=2699483 RepID=A0A4S5EQP9_9ACTN|nr:RidA family protein [Candidatus Frankia alpina]THJ74668.1 RidA family protein [Candidatus Frankia alpina]
MITRVPGQLPSISGAACHGDLVVTSGVICPDLLLPGMTPATTPDIRRQLDGALQALRDVLREAGSDLQYALRVEAYLARPADFPLWDSAFAAAWPAHPPARTTLVTGFALPVVLVELQAIAVRAPAEVRTQ